MGSLCVHQKEMTVTTNDFQHIKWVYVRMWGSVAIKLT